MSAARRASLLAVKAMAFTVMAFAALLADARPAIAHAPAATGWWWIGNQSPRPLPEVAALRPETPDGGLYVAGNPAGEEAVSALRFQVLPSVTDARLELRAAGSSGTPGLQACRVTSAWSPAVGGRWEERPAYDCSTAVRAAASEDGRTFSFEVGPLVAGPVFDVVITAAPTDPAGRPPLFQVAFEAPDSRSLSTSAASEAA
ncbi:MAG: hypothetical protein AB1679_32090, partial [Actinomycetota bacterium]